MSINKENQNKYLTLINALLQCTSDEEISRLLHENEILIDYNLVKLLQQIANLSRERGEEDTAKFLMTLAYQIIKIIDFSSFPYIFPSQEEANPQLTLLLQILRAIHQTNSNPQILYPLIQTNFDKLNDRFPNVLKNWAYSALAAVNRQQAQNIATAIGKLSKLIQEIYSDNISVSLEIEIAGYEAIIPVFNRQDFPELWADIHSNLGSAYSDRVKGEKAENIEESIKNYLAALEIYTRETSAEFWATAQMNVGLVYLERILGERAKNLEEAIACFRKALEVYHRSAFPKQWADIQNNLALAYIDRVFGEKAENLELAIKYCLNAIEIYTPDLFPSDWAGIQNNLGIAYNERIFGNKAENLELAISSYLSSLEVRTRETCPQEWANTQVNLGSAYLERIQGQKVENIETGIRCFEAALEVHTKQEFPQKWADNQSNLGSAYRDRIRGQRATNLELAIRHFMASLKIHTRKTSPKKWADIQNNLGITYQERIQGERAENLETAIISFRYALEVHTKQAFPQKWADIQNNLGNTYLQRVQGEPSENLKAAIYCLKAAVEVHTREAFSQAWADIQNNLGIAYNKLDSEEEKTENIEVAIHCLEAALEVHTREAFPQAWAETQNNLGNIYLRRIQGDKSKNLEKAIQCYLAALEVRTREAFPQAWADSHNNLGNAYLSRIRDRKSENLETAIQCYLNALEVRTREVFPSQYAQTQFNLGFTYQEGKKFRKAYNAFATAIETVEFQREEIIGGSGREENKQKLAEEWNRLYGEMVKVCLEINSLVEAIEYVERSKNRNLVESILMSDRHTIFAAETVGQLELLRDKIAEAQYELQNAIATNPTALLRELQQLLQQRNELQSRYLPIGSNFQFEPLRGTLSIETAIVEFYIAGNNLLVFILTKQTQQPIVISKDLISLNKLAIWTSKYLKAYSNKKNHWQRRLNTRLRLLAKILHIDEIVKQIPKECDKLVLIPHRYLHLLPLHALPLMGNTSLFERFPGGVSYAPSCQLLQLSQTRKRPEFTSLFVVQNPTEDLAYADVEAETIQKFFSTNNFLKQKTATKDAVDNASLSAAHCLHFSCHGYFNGTHPRKSALLLADAEIASPGELDKENCLSLEDGSILNLNKCLTLDAIFERKLNLKKCRLVVLSACETGFIDLFNTSDEYIGLPSGFLYAGAANVVSSLWTVNEISTAFLMIRFYQNLQNNLTVPLALNQAQLWLKNLTKEDLKTWIEENQLKLKPTIAMDLRRRLYKLDSDAKPFQSPLYWAAFCAIGGD